MRRRVPIRSVRKPAPLKLDTDIARRIEAKLDRLLIVWERILAKSAR